MSTARLSKGNDMGIGLFDLTQMQRRVLDGIAVVDEETGEYYDISNIGELDGRIEEKIDACACYVKELEAEIAEMKSEEQRISKRRKAREGKADRIKALMLDGMNACGMVRNETARACVKLRNTRFVDVYDMGELPDAFVRVKQEPDKNAIKDAISKGEDIPGARMADRQSLVIS